MVRFKRRSATLIPLVWLVRGLKPTATIMAPLRGSDLRLRLWPFSFERRVSWVTTMQSARGLAHSKTWRSFFVLHYKRWLSGVPAALRGLFNCW